MATAITVVCPHCSNRMRASSEYIGRKGRCPSCKALLEIRPSAEEFTQSVQPTDAGSAMAGTEARGAATAVNAWTSGMIGVAATAALYGLVFLPLKNSQLGQLFLARGPMPYFITLVTCWGLTMLALKYIAVRQQISYAELELDLIPLEIGVQITPENVDQFLDNLARLPKAQNSSILGRRIRGALEHFKSRNSVPEVQEYLASQAEIEASGVDAGYTLLRAFIWAIPILGFIGTVMGISEAVSGLDSAMKPENAAVAQAPPASTGGGSDQLAAPEQNLMAGLKLVTAGLATAFDTTLVALVMAIVLLFPTESLRKSEYTMLDRIESFANESLLRRMVDQRGALSTEDLPEFVRDTLDGAFREHQRWLAQWQAQVGQLGQVIGAEFEDAARGFQQAVVCDEEQRGQRYEGLVHNVQQALERLADSISRFERAQQSTGSQAQQWIDAVRELEQQLAQNTAAQHEIGKRQLELEKAGPPPSSFADMSALAEKLDQIAVRLDRGCVDDADEPISLESSPPAADGNATGSSSRRRGLLGRIWSRDDRA